MQDALEDALRTIARAVDSRMEDGDYYDSDGLLRCGKCHTRKQCYVTVNGLRRVVPCTCKHVTERYERECEAREARRGARRERAVE